MGFRPGSPTWCSGNLYLEQHFGLGVFGRGVVGTVGGAVGLARPPLRRAVPRPAVPARPGSVRCGSLGLLTLLPSAFFLPFQARAERGAVRAVQRRAG
ncbi:hypothetical protein ACU686_25280 [Yinghuangia aomiensis]